MVADGFRRIDVEEMDIEELYALLYMNADIKKLLRELLTLIDEYSKAIKESRKRYTKLRAPPVKAYKANKGDEVDELLAKWINQHGCAIKITRLGGGFYMFGTKKIYAKIMNGRLVIRVGGGYMSIDEFMKYHGVQEMQ